MANREVQRSSYAATSEWGGRLQTAQERHRLLDGELSHKIGALAISIIDGNTELPENFSLLDIYDRQHLNPDDSGALLYVNYQGSTPPDNAHELIEVIREQRERTTVLAAVALVGYDTGRRIDRVRNDAWDIGVAHVLTHGVSHPVIGISNDADMVSASPDYFFSMTQNEYARQPAKVWGSEVEFSQPGGADLPLHKLVAYLNGSRQLMKVFNNKPVMYGASLGTTLETYVASGGWTGAHTQPNPYGISEPSRLILNVWEQQTGEQGSMEDTTPAYDACARRVDGLAVVSPRREILAYAKELGKKGNMLTHLNTEPTNPYRGLDDTEIARLADTVAVDDPAFIKQLDMTDGIFLDIVPEERRAELREAQRALREELELPVDMRHNS
jgi:hypothetical protein